MMSLTVGLFTQVSGPGPLGALVRSNVNVLRDNCWLIVCNSFIYN